MQPQLISPNQILFFKPIDQLIKTLKQNPKDDQYFIQLFERKKQIIKLMQQGRLDANGYFKFVRKANKNQKLKKYAEQDLLDYLNKYNQKVQQWFQAKINETGQYYQDQQQKYNRLAKKQQNPQTKSKINTNSTVQTNVTANSNYQNQTIPSKNIEQKKVDLNINEISNLKAIDYYLKKYQQTCYKETFILLFEKKTKILKLIQNGSLTFNKYVEFSFKTLNQTKNQDLKKHLKLDLQLIKDIYQNNTNKWFDQTLQQTKNDLSLQKIIFDKHQKGIIVQNYKQMEIQMDNQEKQQEKEINPDDCYSFMVLDQFMDRNDQNPEVYVGLFRRKKELIRLLEKKELDAKMYQQMVIKGLKKQKKQYIYLYIELNRDYIKVYYQMDLENINMIYNSNLKQWFNMSIDQTKGALMLQQYKYQQFKSIVPIKKPTEMIKKQSNKSPIKQKQKIPQITLNFQITQMYSLKILDDQLLNYADNDQLFIKLFQQKNKIINMMSQGQLNAEKYKQMLEKMMQKASMNEQIKSSIQFELTAIVDFHQNDVQKWFQETVQNTGASYDLQNQRYQKLTKKRFNHEEKTQISIPYVSQVFSFTAINKGFKVFANNIEFLQILQEKKQKYIDWINNSKLNGDKYKVLSQKILNSTKNEWIKSIIQQEFNQLNEQFNGNTDKWFASLANLLKQSQKSPNLRQNNQQSIIQKINKGSKKSKINYYLHQMSVYQSLCKYFKTHKLPPSKNQAIKFYLTGPRKQAQQIVQKIKQNSQYDIYSYCKKNFPSLDENLFGQKSQEYQSKVKQYVNHMNEYIKNITQYTKKLRKNVNTKNLQKCKKIIDQCNQNIKYLNSLKSINKLIPLPQIQENKLVLPHIDEFTQLDPNQIQIKILKFQNLKDSLIMKIYYLGKKVKEQKVNNGSNQIVLKIHLEEKDMQNIMKGQPNYISVNLSQKGWFSTTQIGTQYFKTQFIRSNIFEETISVGGVNITYESRVRMAKRPMTTQLTQYKLIKYPAYEHLPAVEQELAEKLGIKKK